MCNNAVSKKPYVLKYVPDLYNSQEMCNIAVFKNEWILKYVPDQYKTQEMCNNAVEAKPEMLRYVPDYFITKEMLEIGTYDEIEASYYKRKKLKKDIHNELALIAWHPKRWWDWCVDIEEKKEVEKMWLK